MNPFKVLFVTYTAVSDNSDKTAFLVVLKRCLRLIANINSNKVEIHLINFDSLPTDDPLVAEVLHRITLE